MLKRINPVSVITIFMALLFICTESAFAQWLPIRRKDAETPQQAVEKPADTTVSETAAQEEATARALKIDTVRKQLNDTAWNIILTESTDKPKKDIIEDIIRFTDNGRMESEHLVSEGFKGSNISIRIRREDRAIWETMQQGSGGELAFWRGDMTRDPETGKLGERISGVLSIHKNDKNKTVINYNFSSGLKSRITDQELVKESSKQPAIKEAEKAAMVAYEAEEPKPATTRRR